eukprot:TRINITY_DN13874_c4_g1_i1.p1 TRINITY_DN13874_c4_g1~~TRINITY_DN13874_c4_g1_i1.p1  ORF type:complete len:425 (+),score=60.48 TRINITY_DN13874_c4_g1_i1:101-1375(+)
MVITPEYTWRQHTGDVTCVEISNCGSYVVSGSADGEINVWMWDTRRVIFNVKGGHSGKGILEVVIPPECTAEDEQRYAPAEVEFITMGRDGCIRFWGVFETTETDPTQDQNGPFIPLRQLVRTASSGSTEAGPSFKAPVLPNPNSDYGDHVTSTTSYSVFKRGTKAYSVRPVATLWHSSFSFCRIKLSVSPEGDMCTLTAPADDGIMRVYCLWGMVPDEVPEMKRKFHPIHDTLQECYRGKESDLPVRFIRDLLPVKGHPVGVCMAFDSADPEWGVVGYESGEISLYSNSALVGMQKLFTEPVMAVSLIEKDQNQRYVVVSAGPEDQLIVSGYSAKSGTISSLSKIVLPSKGCSSVSRSPTNKNSICTTFWDGSAAIYNVKTGKQISVLDAHSKSCLSSTWAMVKGSSTLITCSADTTICIWRI